MSKIKEKINNFFYNLKNKKKSYIKIGTKEKIIFLEQLSNLLNSWIPIINAFKIIILQTKNKNIQKLISSILEDINKWIHLKDIMIKFPNIFNNFDISIIEMWEVSWNIWDSIDLIRDKEEKTKELKWKIMWALIYPIVIITLATAMIIVFMVYVIPKITDMYKDAHVNLPSLTQNVISISEFLQINIINIVIWFFIFILLFKIFKSHNKTKIYYDKMILKIPIFWPLIKKKILALFTSSLWTLLQRWIIINKSLEIAWWTLDNKYYEKEINKILMWISQWWELSEMMWIKDIQKWKENALFPIELSSIVKIWEQTWKLSTLLNKISLKFNKEIDNLIKNLSTALEPIVIIVVWIIVWTIIMAVLLPFFNMVNVVGK